MEKWKLWVRRGEGFTWATNALEFDSKEEAEAWGADLQMRWLSSECNEVGAFPAADDPNTQKEVSV